ncbi:T9SS type A sorting domain-containing protein, partial [Algibacter sp.]|nr:T9SS type A sorting domain-containing protein [Algibacter sp.]
FSSKNLSVYPNPTSSILNIELKNGGSIKKTTILNLVGQQVLKNTTGRTSINISGLSKGMYILKIESSDGTFSKRVIKK